jgi:hypothetical protein
MLVPPAAGAAPGDHEGFTIGHVVDNGARLGIADDRGPGDPDDKIGPVFAGTALARTGFPVFGDIFSAVFEIHQCGHVVVDDHYYISAPAAVASVRSAGGNVFFPAERNCSVSAFPGDDSDSGRIDKHSNLRPADKIHKAPYNIKLADISLVQVSKGEFERISIELYSTL